MGIFLTFLIQVTFILHPLHGSTFDCGEKLVRASFKGVAQIMDERGILYEKKRNYYLISQEGNSYWNSWAKMLSEKYGVEIRISNSLPRKVIAQHDPVSNALLFHKSAILNDSKLFQIITRFHELTHAISNSRLANGLPSYTGFVDGKNGKPYSPYGKGRNAYSKYSDFSEIAAFATEVIFLTALIKTSNSLEFKKILKELKVASQNLELVSGGISDALQNLKNAFPKLSEEGTYREKVDGVLWCQFSNDEIELEFPFLNASTSTVQDLLVEAKGKRAFLEENFLEIREIAEKIKWFSRKSAASITKNQKQELIEGGKTLKAHLRRQLMYPH